MSDNEEQVEEKPFCVDRAKTGRAGCKKCKQKCESGELRLAKLQNSPFTTSKMKCWHHVDCLMEVFLKQRPTTKRIGSTDEIDGWDDLNQDDRDFISKKLEECERAIAEKYGAKAAPKKSPKKQSPKAKASQSKTDDKPKLSKEETKIEQKLSNGNEVASKTKDGLFREFRKLIADITNVSSYTDKTALVLNIFTYGTDGEGFGGDIKLWCRLLLPGVVKRIYNLQSKQLVKLFSKIFDVDQNDMLEHLEQGDIGETIQHFFEISTSFKPIKKSSLTVVEVDKFLEELSDLTKEDEQTECIKKFAKKCTSNDLKIIVRLIKHDLRMNAGAKHILDGVHPDAYEAYQSSRDLNAVIDRCLKGSGKLSTGKIATIKATITLMTPVLPMLAEACKSVEQAMKKCPNGMYSEIKYDGERVQVHKEGSSFKYFSRSLKPVMPHKVAHFKDYIPKAFPHGKDLILDTEILMIDTNTGKPLPFGTLGVHKKSEFKDACVCLFVFDCIYYNGESLTDKPIKLRKRILKENMTEIPNHIVFSEMEEISKPDDLNSMIARVLKLGLEGLVLKDLMSVYEPGKRHWLKVKKDYLFDGAMADSADLIVLGAWYGTGKKGGMMSIFLMGCYDPNKKRFCTVTKVHTGHDDKTLERLQDELDMRKISCDPSKVPDWLHCTKTMIPDFVAKDPKNQPVWEITGAEFTKHDVHTADGMSIRFPRVTKIREDKTWKEATNLQELADLYKNSKESTDVSMLVKVNSESKNGKVLKRKTDLDLGETSIKKQKKTSSDGDDASSKENSLNNNHKKCIDAEDSGKKIKEPIPDYFQNVLLLVENAARQQHSQWIRYFIAHGGVVLNNDDWKSATHVLHSNDVGCEEDILSPKTARHVIVEWIKDSIAKGAMQDYRPYSVRLKSLKKNDSSLKI